MAIIGLDGIFNFANGVLERIFPNPADRLKAQTKLAEMQQNGELAQLAAETDLAKGQQAINLEEAKSGNLFVSGARPFIMWVCGFGLAYHTILQPFLVFCMTTYGLTPSLPKFDTELLNVTLMGMLGLGTMRTVEKIKGV